VYFESNRYVGGILDLFLRGDVAAGGAVKTNPFTPMVAIPTVNMVSTLCALLEGLLVPKNCPPEGPKEVCSPLSYLHLTFLLDSGAIFYFCLYLGIWWNIIR
jgi:hypothetical protein